MVFKILISCLTCLFFAQVAYADIYEDIRKGDVKKVEEFFQGNKDHNYVVNSKDDNDQSFLCEALQSGKLDVVTFLFQYDVDVNADCRAEPVASTPLMEAIQNHYYDIAKRLINRGANLQEEDFSALALAIDASKGNLEFVNYLLNLKNFYVDVNSEMSYGDGFAISPIRAAMYIGDYELFTRLLKRGAELDKEIAFDDLEGNSVNKQVILSALKGGNKKILDYILTHGFKLDNDTVKFLDEHVKKLPQASLDYLKVKNVVLKNVNPKGKDDKDNAD